ncbi:flavodoxin [Luteimonas sp. MJ250]|uniref:flavodoxin n=1 Tax=Luteimonas sp. MJ250 TaxID=3129236 RepID=UPI0031BB1F96
MRILIAYDSLSGNTRDLARMVRARCEARGHAVTWIETGIQAMVDAGPDPRHDLYLLGTWTDNAGRTPAAMKRFIAELVEAVGRPEQLAVFGTGETQWGAEYYCGALRRMARFFDSRHPPLEIEQMPHGARDVLDVQRWTDRILAAVAGARVPATAGATTGAGFLHTRRQGHVPC